MDYDQLLQRHHELLRNEVQITERLKDASGSEIAELECQLRKIATESDNVLDLMFTLLEDRALSANDKAEAHQEQHSDRG